MQPIEPIKVGRSRGTGAATNAPIPTKSPNPSRAGICIGTPVLTLDGLLPVDHLTEGDRVITRDQGAATVLKIRCARIARRMYRVKTEGSAEAIFLPAGQRVLIRDWRAKAMFGRAEALVPIEKLVDGEWVRDIGTQKQTLFQLGFARPHIIYAGGLELASSVVRRQNKVADAA